MDDWLATAGISKGKLFRRVSKAVRVWGQEVTDKVIWHVVKEFAKKVGINKLAPHDLRRSCARLCHTAGGELEQIQFLLGHGHERSHSGRRGDYSGVDRMCVKCHRIFCGSTAGIRRTGTTWNRGLRSGGSGAWSRNDILWRLHPTRPC